jgi:hypothetical protein
MRTEEQANARRIVLADLVENLRAAGVLADLARRFL